MRTCQPTEEVDVVDVKGEKKLRACNYQEHVDEGDEHCEADHPEKHHMHHIFLHQCQSNLSKSQ